MPDLKLSHLRVDHVPSHYLRVDQIDRCSQGLKALKVLVLRHSRARRSDLFEPFLPNDISSSRAGRVATAIAAQDLPLLRVIVVGDYRFWVERFPGRQRRFRWYLRKALEDLSQSQKILRIMDQSDWDFLAEKPEQLNMYPPADIAHEVNRLVVFNNKAPVR